MTAFYDFFRFIKLYSTDGTTLEATLEADAVTDSLNISRGNGVAFTGANAGTDSFKIDVDYDLTVPISTTSLRLSDVNGNNKDIALVAGGNMTITRNSSGQLTIAALVGGVSKSISAITQGNPARVTTTNAHGYTEATPVTIVDVLGMTNLNGNEYFMDVIDSTNFDLYTDELLTTGVNSASYPAYTSGGVATANYGGAKQAFKTIRVSGQSDIEADTIADLLTLVGGTGIDITTTAGTDTVTYAIDSSVVTLNDSQTLTNKTLTDPSINALSGTTIALSTNTLTFDDDVLPSVTGSKYIGSQTLMFRKGFFNEGIQAGTYGSFHGQNFTAPNTSLNLIGGGGQSTRNRIVLQNGTASPVQIQTGSDASQNIEIECRNGGTIYLKGATTYHEAGIVTQNGSTGPGFVSFSETSTNGSNAVKLIGPASTSDQTLTLPSATDTLVGKATTDTLTNKTIDLTDNTISGTLAEFNTAVSDATLVSTTGTETLSNKTLNSPGIDTPSMTAPVIAPTASDAGYIDFMEATNNGSGKIRFYGASSVTSNSTLNILLPNAAGTVVVSASAPLSRSSAGDISLGTVPISKGGTNSTTASDARTALGLAIGTDVQAYDADLAAIAGLTSAADTGIYFTGSGTAGTFTLGAIGRTFLGATNIGNAAGSQRKLLGVDNDDNVQMGSLGIGTAASGTAGEIRATDNITGYYSSDSRLKENIQNIDGALEKVAMLKGVTFDWCENYIKERGGEDGYFIKKHDTGLIAQDVQEVLPEIVRKKKDGYLGVQYDKMVGLLVEAIKELRTEINELKSKR